MSVVYLATLSKEEVIRRVEALGEDLDESKQEKRHFRKLYEEVKQRLTEVEKERDKHKRRERELEGLLEAAQAETARLLQELAARDSEMAKGSGPAEPQVSDHPGCSPDHL